MKYTALFLAMFSLTANATYKAPEPTSSLTSLPSASSSATSASSANVTNATTNETNATGGDTQIDFEAKRNPVNSAIAPSVTNFQSCPIVTSDSKAIQAPFFGISGTTGVSLNPICYALQRNQLEIADKMMCAASKEYAKANTACGE
jgi:hypothetical protein